MEEREQDPAPALTPRRAAAIGSAIGGFFLLLVLLTMPFYGMSWDEGFYFPTYQNVGAWAGTLITSPGEALSSDGIRAGWERINELPPLTKWIGATAYALSPDSLKVPGTRLPFAFLFGATVALIFFVLQPRTGPWPAALAAVLYGAHPRLFGHAHFAASETLFAFLNVAIIAAAFCIRHPWKRAAVLVLLVGLALATKVNGLITLIALVCWLAARAWTSPPEGDEPRTMRWRRDMLTIPVLLIAAPLVALAVWPWMWDETLMRLREYWLFIADHGHWPTWYLGVRYNTDSAGLVPWHFPFVMTAVTAPVIWLVAVLSGAAVTVAGWIRLRRLPGEELLVALMAAGPVAALMLPDSPRYDVLRLFVPAFGPLVILAGLGLGRLLSSRSLRRRRMICGLAMGLMIATAAGGWPAGLRYYNAPARLLSPDGLEFPFEISYWQEIITPGIWEEIDELMPPGEIRIRPLALHGLTFEVEQDLGRIPGRFVFGAEPPPDWDYESGPFYHAHLMQNRKGFWGRTEWWFALERPPLASWGGTEEAPALYLFDGRPPGQH